MSILFVLKMLILTANPSLTVDRVESDRAPIAVVCSDESCVNVPTVRGKGGLREGQAFNACETVGPRLDGTSVVICGGHVAAYIDIDGARRENPYFTGAR